MKIRKQFQKQAEEMAMVEKKLSRQIETGGGVVALVGGSSPAASEEGGGASGHPLEVDVDQSGVQEEESNSGSCGDWTVHVEDHNNARRKYARRSLRSAGAAGTSLVVQAGINGTFSNGQAVVANVIQRRSNPSRGESRCPGDKTGHPSEEPEGSLLHCLYLQLLAAGSEGMTLKEVFASFASQTRFSRLGSNWRDQVKSYLTTNLFFKVVKARYFLSEQLQPPPKAASKPGRNLMDLNVEPRASRRFASPDAKPRQTSQCDTPSSDPSVVNNEREGVQTRRKAYERTIEAVLNESAVEFQKTQKLEEIGEDRSTDEFSTASRRSSDLHMAATMPPESATIGGPSRKRKSPVVAIHGMDIPEPIDFRHTGAVPGSLKAMQARIVAETGVQKGSRCSRKDGSNHHSKWQCPMTAMEGRSLCQHHNFLSERKKARYKKAKRQAAGRSSPPPPPPPPPPRDRDSQERAIPSRKVTELQDLNQPPREDLEPEELSNELVDDSIPAPAPRIMRTRSDAHTNGSLAESANNVHTDDMDSETEGGQELLPSVKSRSVNAPSNVPEPGRQSFRSTRKPRLYLAAKKTAEKTPVVAPAPGKSVKKQSVPLIRPPSIPPLPMLYGVRRKSMKNRPSQLTL